MLVCNVSLLQRRAAVAADVAEVAAAVDATATGNIVFATLVDDPASVGDRVDAYLGEIMHEAASAADSWSASVPHSFAADVVEAAGATADASAAFGYTGTMTADDLTMRVSEAADGEDAVRQVLAFAQALSEATSRT